MSRDPQPSEEALAIRQAAITITAALLQIGDMLAAAANQDVASDPMSNDDATEWAGSLWQKAGEKTSLL